MVREILNEIKERLGSGVSVDFCLYCDPEKITNIQEHNKAWRDAARSLPSGQNVEVQYETRFDLGYWEALPQFLRGNVDGVHAPTKGRDIASSDESHRKWSLQETIRSMDLAHGLDAKYFVLHLTPQDDFQDRNRQLERGFKSLEELTDYYKNMEYDFKILPEILEHPKSPANKTESVKVLEKAKTIFNKYKIAGKLGFCLDVAHLWHNLKSLLPDRSPFDFKEELDDYISEISKHISIDVVHLAGAYVEDGGENQVHVTHAYPGLMMGEHYSQTSRCRLDERPSSFNGDWMDADTVLRSIKRIKSFQGKDPIITIEAHDPNIENQLTACRKISRQYKTL